MATMTPVRGARRADQGCAWWRWPRLSCRALM